MTKLLLGVAVGYIFHDAMDGFVRGFTQTLNNQSVTSEDTES